MWPPIAGLAAALLVDWLFCPAPRRPDLSLWGLAAETIPYAALTLLASAGAAAVFAKQSKFRDEIVIGVASAGVWCAPLVVLIRDASIWAIVPTVVLAAKIAALFPRGSQSETPSYAGILTNPEIRLMRQFPASLCAALCFQVAAVGGLMQRPLIAGPFLTAGTALLARQAMRVWPRTWANSRRVWIGISCAVLFALFGMVPYLKMGSGGNATFAVRDVQDGASAKIRDSYRGIILWPPIQEHVTIVPPLPAMPSNPLEGSTQPLSIPFAGVYWFFRNPYTNPPEGSVEMHGEPTDLTFRSLNARPLLMEARQNLGKFIDLKCCQRIEMAIQNRDRFSSIVSIELLLVDSSIPERPLLSLGVDALKSRPGLTSLRDTVAASETLRFPVPRERAIERFDEFVVRFERPEVRALQSANIGIEGFMLVPNGR